MQTGEGKLHLGLDACRPNNPTPMILFGQLQEESGLAATRFATKNQNLALRRAHARNELIQQAALAQSVKELGGSPRRVGHENQR
jgi:hypothetical protein